MRWRSVPGQLLLLLALGTVLSLLRAAAFAEPALCHPSEVQNVLREQTPLFAWTPEEIREAGDIVIVDGRAAREHAALHPTGAIPLPSQEREKALDRVWPELRGRRVAVLTGADEIAMARDLAAFLARHAGVSAVGTVRGGWEGWRDGKLPCTKGGG